MMRKKISHYLESLFGANASLKTPLLSGGILFFFEAALLLFSGYVEGTYFFEKSGVGALQTGMWVVVIGDWILLLLIFFLSKQLWRIPDSFPVAKAKSINIYLISCRDEIQNRLLLKKNYKTNYLLLLFSGSGVIFYAYNFIRLKNYQLFFDFPMFDTYNYKLGFWSARFIYFTSWVILIPYLAFVSTITLVLVRKLILESKRGENIKFHYNFSHSDQHGGFIYLQKINTVFLLCITVIFLELIAEIYTMTIIVPTVKFSLVLLTIAFIGVTFWFMRPVEQYLKEVEKRANFLLDSTELSINDPTYDYTSFLVKYNHIKKNVNFTLNTFWSKIIFSTIRGGSVLSVVYKLSNMHFS